MEPEKYIYNQAPTALSWEPGSEWDVAASMLDMFHKLPSAGKDFLESHDHRPGIVVLTIGLEEAYSHLSSSQIGKPWSPFRAPLIRFLNKYAKESVAYFLRTTDSKNRLAQQEYFDILLDIIEEPLAKPLLQELKASTKTFIAIMQDSSQNEGKIWKCCDTYEMNCILKRKLTLLLCRYNRMPKKLYNSSCGNK